MTFDQPPSLVIIDFGWGWLGKEKSKEEVQSDDSKNTKYRRSWSEIVKRSSVNGGQIPPLIPTAAAAITRRVISTTTTYSGEKVLVFLAATRGVDAVRVGERVAAN